MRLPLGHYRCWKDVWGADNTRNRNRAAARTTDYELRTTDSGEWSSVERNATEAVPRLGIKIMQTRNKDGGRCSSIQPANVAVPLAAKIRKGETGKRRGLALLDLAMTLTLLLATATATAMASALDLADCSCTICRLGDSFLGHPLAAILPLATWFYATNHWHNLKRPIYPIFCQSLLL